MTSMPSMMRRSTPISRANSAPKSKAGRLSFCFRVALASCSFSCAARPVVGKCRSSLPPLPPAPAWAARSGTAAIRRRCWPTAGDENRRRPRPAAIRTTRPPANSLETVCNLLLTGPNPRVTHFGQLVRVQLALQNRPHDRHSRHATEINDGVGQLYIHHRQCLLDVLHRPPGIFDHPVAQSPDRAQLANLLRGRNDLRSSPYVCHFRSHWHSCTSLLRSGRFLVPRAFTRYSSSPSRLTHRAPESSTPRWIEWPRF